MSERRAYMPLYIDMTDRKVMVIGSGETGAMILRSFAPYTEKLYYLTEDTAPDIPSGAAVLAKAYERSDLYGMDYVVCAAEDEAVREDVFATCRTLGIRVCVKGSPKRCDFFLSDR